MSRERLEEEVRQLVSEGRPRGPTVHINGFGVVGDHNTVSAPRRFNPDSPHAVDCPQCGETVGRYSEICGDCFYRVRAHFDAVDEQVRQREAHAIRQRQATLAFCMLVAGMVMVSLSGSFMPVTLAGFAVMGASVLIFKGLS